MINNILNKPELCACCSRPIRTGHPFILCQECNCIIHKKCTTTENVLKFRGATYCKMCFDSEDIVRYNPFYQPPNFSRNDQFNDEPLDYIRSVDTINNILENCKTHTASHLNSNILPSDIQKDFLSTFFLNIDGNSTNFDSLAVQLSNFKHKFSIIGLAETNTDPVNSCLFQLKDYNSCYQDRFFNVATRKDKEKGSGVCLYLHNSLNFTKLRHLSLCKDSIESLFVEITNLPEPIIAGVIYRPPNNSLTDFNRDYKNLLSQLNGKKAYILGDFNANLCVI